MATTYLECGDKFWKSIIDGTKVTVIFGKVGTPGQNRVKTFGNPTAASAFAGKVKDEKLKKGYALAGRGGGGASSGGAAAGKATAKGKAKGKAKAKAAAAVAGAKRKAAPARGEDSPAAKRGKAADGTVASPSRGASASSRGRGGGRRVDSRCTTPGLKVVDDYSVTLNQTNVGANNNKFYIIQVLEGGGAYYAWNRWGRVGDDGQNKLLPCSTKEQAVKEFGKKFREKTTNSWENRSSFTAVKGKYTLVETEESGGGGQDQAPMGKLSEAQIGKGQAVLQKLGAALSRKNASQVTEMSSEFYSLIPHNFGWKKPVAITTPNMLQEKEELLKFFLRMGFEKVDAGADVSPIDGIMALPLPASLDEAAKGCCSAGSISGSNRKGADLASKQAGAPTKAMSAALYAAIMLYTSNAIYADLNKCLRDKNRAKIKRYFKYLRLLFDAMNCLPRKKRTLWRGISVDVSGDPQYAPGQTVTWWGVSSCTSDQNVAKNFAAGCGGGCTVVTVQSLSACDISAISFFSNEKESLLRPGTQLKVKSRNKKGNVTELVLEEVGCAIG